MLPRFIRILLGLGVTVVVVLFGLNLYINLKPAPKPLISQPLISLLPTAPPGWSAEDEAIADTPEMQEAVEDVLHFDDAAYRVYDNGNAQIAIYVAHWLPGKFSPAKVGSHSPDTCWVHHGWTMLERNQDVTRELAGGTLKPLETGIFEKDGEQIHVMFWHLVGGESVNYDLTDWENGLAGRLQRLPAMLADFTRFGLDQRREQLVVRVSSNVPFKLLWEDAGFKQVMDDLSHSLNLYAKLPPAGA
jgi:hypothetical protein